MEIFQEGISFVLIEDFVHECFSLLFGPYIFFLNSNWCFYFYFMDSFTSLCVHVNIGSYTFFLKNNIFIHYDILCFRNEIYAMLHVLNTRFKG